MILITAIARTASALQRIMALLAGCATTAAVMRQQRRTFYSLSSLDDHTLQDIGLTRTMLLGVSIHGGCPGVKNGRRSAPAASTTENDDVCVRSHDHPRNAARA